MQNTCLVQLNRWYFFTWKGQLNFIGCSGIFLCYILFEVHPCPRTGIAGDLTERLDWHAWKELGTLARDQLGLQKNEQLHFSLYMSFHAKQRFAVFWHTKSVNFINPDGSSNFSLFFLPFHHLSISQIRRCSFKWRDKKMVSYNFTLSDNYRMNQIIRVV